ncbi:MAG: hypothetical protein EXS35_02375 [Pedosphaera sp.]|nr:hypothetical protein [Pedosphaera sp.]
MERIFATYRIETSLAVEPAAAALAGEQSSGTFVAVPGETAELKQRFAARVEKITPLETVSEPSLPGCRSGTGKFQRAEIVVSWSVENMGCNLPTLVSTIQGNLYELSQFSGLKLMDVELPPSFAKHFRGPRFGITGCRELTKVNDRPLIGTIIKPSIGLSPQQTAELVKTLAEAGIDFVKDDELMADPPHSPFDERVDAIMRVVNAHADRTGKKVMYAFNVSDELDAMQRHYEKIVQAGGTCAMISLNSVGLAGAKKICDLGAVVAGVIYHWLTVRLPKLDSWMPAASMFGIVYFTLVTTAAGRDNLVKIGGLLFLAAALHNAAGYFFGYWLSRACRLDKNSARSIAFEVGLQNGGMASGLAGKMGMLGTLGLAAATFSPWMNVSGSILANYWRKRPVK